MASSRLDVARAEVVDEGDGALAAGGQNVRGIACPANESDLSQ
jgi:hypothetical protein